MATRARSGVPPAQRAYRDHLAEAAELARCQGDWLLAGPLTRYAQRHRLGVVDLAAGLGLSVTDLYRLMLWRTPTTPAATSRAAEYFGANPARLANVIAACQPGGLTTTSALPVDRRPR